MSVTRVLLGTVAAAAMLHGAQASTAWDEGSSGDFANVGASPTAVNLGLGSNLVIGSTGRAAGIGEPESAETDEGPVDVAVEGDDDGELRVDGRPRGPERGLLHLAPGRHHVTLVVDGRPVWAAWTFAARGAKIVVPRPWRREASGPRRTTSAWTRRRARPTGR